MTTNIQTTPYLSQQRNFPKDSSQLLAVQLDKTYIDIATRINERTIGIFGVNFQIVTGETWFISGQTLRQQSLRQIYVFTTFAPINHGLTLSQIERFVRGFGSYTDDTNWYGLIFGTNVALAGQAVFYITPTQIVFNTAGVPASTKGTVILEWLSQF